MEENKKHKRENAPCRFDHNGECLICDCWPSDCAYIRMINKDYRWESKEELEEMFTEEQLEYYKKQYK
jgi:hypothetical protein